MRTRVIGLAWVVSLCVASAAYASEDRMAIAQWRSADSASLPSFRLPKAAIDKTIDYRLSYGDAIHAAADDEAPEPAAVESPWMRNLTPFLTYNYASSRDRRRGGIDGDINGGTVGMTFKSLMDMTAGLMYDYSYCTGPGGGGVDMEMHSNTFTFFLSKNIELLYFGASFSFGDAEMRTYRLRRRTSVDVDTFAVAPYLGLAAYQKGPLSLYSTLTCVWRWQDFRYNRAIPSDDSSSGTLVLMNRANYELSEQFMVTGIFDFNDVVQEELTNMRQEDVDHCWLTMGVRFRYHLTDTAELYAGYTADVANQSYENHQVEVGVSLAF